MWILDEIETHKKKKGLTKIIIIALLLLVWGYFSYSYFSWNSEIVEVKEIKTVSVTTGDLKTSISGDWKVLYKEDFNLNFPITWTVKTITKNEWAIVKAWDIIATLDTTYLEINVDKAEISLKKAYADLESKKNKYTSGDIKLSEEQLWSSEANLENIKLNWEIDISNTKSSLETAEINLKTATTDLQLAKDNLDLIIGQEEEKYENKVEDAIWVISTNISSLRELLLDVDKLLWVTPENKDENDKFEDYLWAKDSNELATSISYFNDANLSFTTFLDEWKEKWWINSDIETTLEFLEKAQNNSMLVNKMLNSTLKSIKNSIPSLSALSEEEIEAYIKTFEANILDNKKDVASLTDASQLIEEQLTNLNTKTATQNNTVASLTSKLELAVKQLDQAKINYNNALQKADNNVVLAEKQIAISEASLSTKTDDVSYSELAPYYTSIDTAKKALEESQIRLDDAVLRSPIDWKIVSVDWNIGSFVWWDKESSFVTITNNNKFYVESYVEELDISRIQENASVYLTYDALDWVSLAWQVYFISDKSTTDNNGIVTYKVEISFDPKTSGVREWMTTYVEYVTNEVKNAKIIPVWAVKPIDWAPSVMTEDWTWVPVITWFTDGKMVEVISGLEKWAKVVY